MNSDGRRKNLRLSNIAQYRSAIWSKFVACSRPASGLAVDCAKTYKLLGNKALSLDIERRIRAKASFEARKLRVHKRFPPAIRHSCIFRGDHLTAKALFPALRI